MGMMMRKNPPTVIDFGKINDSAKDDIKVLEKEIMQIESDMEEKRREINSLLKIMIKIAQHMGIPIEEIPALKEDRKLLNVRIDDLLLMDTEFSNGKYSKFPKLNTQDIIVCSLAGILSTLIDVIFVGTPEVVKIYKGGENFDGSILTEAIRKIGNNDNGKSSEIFKWFSDKCKVPYDISLKSDMLTPNNHRLRSPAHDPFFGLLFAVADIILGTTTCIDNNGSLAVIVNPNKSPTSEKWLAVFYYLGHIISDMCTSRGIPIPGFFATQFYTAKISDSSIAEIAESMYKDGYDLRHMASMSVPVLVKDVLINVYLKLTRENTTIITSLCDREKYDLDFKLKTCKMKFIANSIATIGNAVKFAAPPNCGNPCALNIVQWMAFVQNSINMVAASTRGFTPEKVMYNRQRINKRWEKL
jgi:hypothetical protein